MPAHSDEILALVARINTLEEKIKTLNSPGLKKRVEVLQDGVKRTLAARDPRGVEAVFETFIAPEVIKIAALLKKQAQKSTTPLTENLTTSLLRKQQITEEISNLKKQLRDQYAQLTPTQRQEISYRINKLSYVLQK